MSPTHHDTLPTGSVTHTADLSRPVPQLFVLARRDELAQPGSRHRLDGLEVVNISRGDPDVHRQHRQLYLGIADARLSLEHARLIRTGNRWHIEDRGSTNGTRINGRRVEREALTDGAIIDLGRTILLYRDTVPVAATTPLDSAERAVDAVDPTCLTFHDPLRLAWERIARVAGQVRVLVRGPTGAGKEVAARAIHRLSGRRGPFIAVNCAGLPPDLLAAELFGHRAGAFSGARESRAGYLRAAHGGTLFLDEVDSLPLGAQATLLRPLAQNEVVPVGGERAVPIDAMVISATNADLDQAVEEGAFREDLFARLAEHELSLPTLAERREDLGILVRALLADLAHGWPRLDRDAAFALFSHHWPRNVRALRNALRVALASASAEVLRRSDLPRLTRPIGQFSPPPVPAGPPMDDPMCASLVQALQAANGNARAAAAAMGVARSTFYRRLERYEIDPDDYREP